MKCPVCVEPDLSMTTREGIEIDYCPKCRGVWLDRGELDKIIERSQGETAAPPPSTPGREYREDGRRYGDDDDYKYRHKKKRGWADIFDFD
jgi:Zn-finger nucleic acid-binding protein